MIDYTCMGTSTFQFKQFTICQDRCAMKVGTDAVLLGSWVHTGNVARILDVGTGTGVIALMLAQRTSHAVYAPQLSPSFHPVHVPATVDALELDPAAADQAKENVRNSPWAERVHVHATDATNWSALPYDLIVSNPPFFRQSLKAPAANRSQARHDDTLSWEQLAGLAAQLLAPEGHFALILPAASEGVFEAMCWERGLYLNRHCAVSTREDTEPKRLLLEFSRRQGLVEYSTLALQTPAHQRTEAFSNLTADFYLK
jgi:tRNA1Val (adenine37-N6)-methyltransferase